MKITGYNNNNKPCFWLDSIADGKTYLKENCYNVIEGRRFNTLQKIFDCAFGSVQGLQFQDMRTYTAAQKIVLYVI